MAKYIYILGAGGHGRVVLDALLSGNVQVTGFLDQQPKKNQSILGIPIVGNDQFLEHLSTLDTLLVNGLGANPNIFHRQNLFKVNKKRGFSFKSLVHPSAIISNQCNLGEGSQVMAGAVMQTGVNLGENVVINTCASIDHDCDIYANSFIAPGAVLCGDIIVEMSTFIGAGAIILPGVKIGENAIIGAGAVVLKSVPDHAIMVGNPAIKIGDNEIT